MTNKVAFLLANDFEDSEMKNPYDAITKNGNEGVIISLEKGAELKGKQGTIAYTSHLSIDEAKPEDYEALIIPGGKSPAHLIGNEKVLEFVRHMDKRKKTIAAICHGPQLLEKAGLIQGRNLTAYPELHAELNDAGGRYIDNQVVVDDNWITSRTPDDEPAFIEAIIKKLGVNAY
ncbi:type 1 glutamine amidotransferase domain-containing protein [Paenibacillus sacheonensis]|uniref:DJ-1/PfpI/YhbO family deglycase/protease n=1 Tax=Paenibacillus sacheonensis TaxID=742054 RepID=A0A7X5C0F7_9BACL|nr:type 1 glutamine amidotransferase domain-containing protein [Paenibacillus sacheonensis]MBM7563072.1 protease I [Paenibacillus sacheonensis]NBC68359.1 DJ-1/PfpI/YhbO family deglycase/protease [Paenibacillus sacheonensis]